MHTGWSPIYVNLDVRDLNHELWYLLLIKTGTQIHKLGTFTEIKLSGIEKEKSSGHLY